VRIDRAEIVSGEIEVDLPIGKLAT